MKVSRKVRRRKHSRTSSISLRRLSNKNRKHTKTQKRGKYGKHGRVHKRARTYKHGKRFHKGGAFAVFRMGKKTSFDPTTGVISNLKYTKKNFSIIRNATNFLISYVNLS